MKTRQPILTVLGHVDHGKTTLLDYIRSGKVARGEAGGITQMIGATEVPVSTIEKICGGLLKKWNINLEFPGLLFIDTPGHEAFTLLRKRGGALADLAILVIDVTEGLKPQTEEALELLKQQKTPFIVAANKIDKLSGWRNSKNACFTESFELQEKNVQEELDTKIYELIGQLYEKGFETERFDRVEEFTKQVSIVPISALNGEGVADLLTLITGLTQKYLGKKLDINPDSPGKGSVLEVENVKGLGTTINVILYDGILRKGDTILIGHPSGPIETKIKAILKARALQEIRVEKRFRQVNEIVAASGIKIAAPNLDDVIAGVTLLAAKDNIREAMKEVQEAIESIEIETESDGVIVRTDTIGSLEATINLLKKNSIPIKQAKMGLVSKEDIVKVQEADEKTKVIMAFNTPVNPEAEKLAEAEGVKIIKENIIYRLIGQYEEHIKDVEERRKREILETVTMPCKMRILPNFVFRQSKPAVVGVEILGGTIKSEINLMNDEGKIIGSVHALQDKGTNIQKASIGEQVAVSIDGGVVGRNINEGDVLFSVLSKEDYKTLVENMELLSDNDRNALEEIKEIMKKNDKYWDVV